MRRVSPVGAGWRLVVRVQVRDENAGGLAK